MKQNSGYHGPVLSTGLKPGGRGMRRIRTSMIFGAAMVLGIALGVLSVLA